MYTCGLTVYARGHIGNFRTFVAQDLLRRFREWKGYSVLQVQNFTDVDDKTIRGAREAGEPLRDHTTRFIDYYHADAEALAIRRARHYPRATDPRYIAAMVRLVERLLERGAAYRCDGSVYFRIAAFPAYGQLSGAGVEGRQAGARVDADEYDKENAADFVLWKATADGEPTWEAPFGAGRPGWHLECSAMALERLGPGLDLHCGGVDLLFPHHENEIAQSEAAVGKPFVRHWFHCEHLRVEGQKMSKSLGNYYTVRELLDEGTSPAALRYLLASVHYRKPLNFTREGLRQAETAVRRVNALLARSPSPTGDRPPASSDVEIRTCLDRFEEALDDDLNVSKALAEVFFALRRANRRLNQPEAGNGAAVGEWAAAIRRMNDVFGVFEMKPSVGDPGSEDLAAEIEALIRERRGARRRGDYARADRARGHGRRDDLATAGLTPAVRRLRRSARRLRRLAPRLDRRPRASHLRLGVRGERIAARALARAGYRVVARNYRPGGSRRYAEIDIVAWDGRTLAAVEVKTRRGGWGRPAERVDRRKRLRLRRSAARMWRVESARRRIPPGSRLRMDVVEVWFPAGSGSAGPDRVDARVRDRFRSLFAAARRGPVTRIHRGAF